jgi:hypothetical protein
VLVRWYVAATVLVLVALVVGNFLPTVALWYGMAAAVLVGALVFSGLGASAAMVWRGRRGS